MPTPVPVPQSTIKHTALEDAQGLATGAIMCTMGVVLLTHLGLITGQTAGLAVVIAYLMDRSFGLVFFVINIPFYLFAIKAMGWEFTLKSLGCVAALSIGTELVPLGFAIERLDPALGAVMFGVVTGIGLLAIFRHKGSLGGLGVLAIWIQDRFGIRAGYIQLGFDALLFTVAAFLFPLSVVMYSLLGAVVLNGLIAFNHRRDWYIPR
ncbi:MAG: YitT family protein [Devosiaceae bacterium]|nr:YitT family protein [Devosiaceae bacterium MH13]